VPIKPSSAKEIESLIADLSADRAATREAAIARLTIIGARAVERLATLATSNGPAAARTAALQALDAIGDPRGRTAILDALADPDAAVALAAAVAGRRFLHGRHSAEALDRLTQIALDRTRDRRVRAAAVRAVCTLDEGTIAPLIDALRGDSDPQVRDAARGAAAVPDSAAVLMSAAGGELPSDPAVLREAVVRAGANAPLHALLGLVEAVRAREAQEPAAARTGWITVRAAAHVALAMRGSRIGLYDLRESLESADDQLPVEWIAALSAVGDRTCIEAIATACARTRDPWWREHLASAFHTIVRREGLTRRHAVMKKIEKKWPSAISSMTDENG
jgi:HEAT repeat protein